MAKKLKLIGYVSILTLAIVLIVTAVTSGETDLQTTVWPGKSENLFAGRVQSVYESGNGSAFALIKKLLAASSNEEEDDEEEATVPLCHATGKREKPYEFMYVGESWVDGIGWNDFTRNELDIINVGDENRDGTIDILDCMELFVEEEHGFEEIVPLCGNGESDPGEQCDDGNDRNHDGCSNRCTYDEVMDFGDAPDIYRTLERHNGARHVVNDEIYLGMTIDGDYDGMPNSDALSDDVNIMDDEDGVKFGSVLKKGKEMVLRVEATNDGFLDAWIDFNVDGVWDDANERIFSALPLLDGTNFVSFVVPGSAASNKSTYARFRYGTAGNLAYYGEAENGEVEDYMVFISGDGSPVVSAGLKSVPKQLSSCLNYDSYISKKQNPGFEDFISGLEFDEAANGEDLVKEIKSKDLVNKLDIIELALMLNCIGIYDAGAMSLSGFHYEDLPRIRYTSAGNNNVYYPSLSIDELNYLTRLIYSAYDFGVLNDIGGDKVGLYENVNMGDGLKILINAAGLSPSSLKKNVTLWEVIEGQDISFLGNGGSESMRDYLKIARYYELIPDEQFFNVKKNMDRGSLFELATKILYVVCDDVREDIEKLYADERFVQMLVIRRMDEVDRFIYMYGIALEEFLKKENGGL